MAHFIIRSRLAYLADTHNPPLTISDVAEMTGVSLGTVRRWYYDDDRLDRFDAETMLAFYQYFQLNSLDHLLALGPQDEA
jgi:DNA-binding transcriptional MerR regulator